jgi:hypothetical protein
MHVLAEDVRRYGPRDAIVLAALRKIGATSSVPVIISASKLGALVGMPRTTAWRALDALRNTDAVRVASGRIAKPSAVRVMDVGRGVPQAVHTAQDNVTQQAVGGVSQPAHQIGTRLSTLRALLAVSG